MCCVKKRRVKPTACDDIAWSESPLVLGYIRLRLHGIVMCANLECVCDDRVMRYRHCLYIMAQLLKFHERQRATLGGPVVPLERQRKAILVFPSPAPSLRSTKFALWLRPSWISCSTVV